MLRSENGARGAPVSRRALVLRSMLRSYPHRRLLAAVEEHVGELHEWPAKEQRLVLAAADPGRLNIFRFVLFLLGNGAPPRAVARLLVGGGLVRKPKEKRDAWDVFVAFRDGKLRPDAFYWCMRSRQRAEVNHPRSWCRGGVPVGMRDPKYWSESRVLLRM